eukprot:TRINITY_DN2727_c0_g1_i1.p1 TRINITY_DN2727_c0_g1~~TRINITY_DN2727_c0_g1_i1.p1  ORF type:complete len:374 (-),score=62.11 TRINITY_DN2727_c0_g1_i1:149-1270(-)
MQQQRNSGAQTRMGPIHLSAAPPPSKKRKLTDSNSIGIGERVEQDDMKGEINPPPAAATRMKLNPNSSNHTHPPAAASSSSAAAGVGVGGLGGVERALRVNRADVTVDESSVLGCGAYASVCYGTFKGTPVAVKRFRAHVPDEEFEKELRIVNRLDHPHVIACLGFYRHGSDRWILLEWAERGSLFEVLHPDDRLSFNSRGPLSWKRKLTMAHDIADAMTFIHQSKYRHCDLNSKNLLVTSDFRIKVADLGLSHQVAEDGSSQLMDRRIGTLRWMAPEMLAKSCKSMEKADVYSFGVVLYEIGSEQIPYHDKLDDDVRRLILRNVSPVGDSNAWRNQPGFRDLMNACLHQDPSQRPDFPTISATLLGILSDIS